MKRQRSLPTCAFAILLAFLLLPTLSLAQLISLKTVPVASGDQFMIFPSQNLAMGGVSIALNDPLMDAFVNPAKGVYARGFRFFSAPAFYSIADNNGGASTLPVGGLLGSERWFAGFVLAGQQLAAPDRFGNLRGRNVIFDGIFSQAPPVEKDANNLYAAGLIGTKLPGSRISVAAGVFWAGLEGIEGVDLLYANSQKIEQFGNMVDYRIGVAGELRGQRSFEVLFLYNRFKMTHDVTYRGWFRESANAISNGNTLERNLDRTKTWGLHLGYVQPFGQDEWRIGWILTANRKSHPKIPNYELMNIPRDPGNSWAFNLGVGISSNLNDPGIFAIDLIYEPIWSNTWADTPEMLVTRSGRFIPAGGKTVINDFRFSNWRFHIGIGHHKKIFGYQLGLQVRWFRYRLDQTNKVEEFQRSQKESWAEWTPSLGLILKYPAFEIRYTGRLTTGTGRPGVVPGFGVAQERALANDFIVAPSGSLTLQEAKVFTHQISVSIPFRR
jgi:hypothetical protein